MDRVFQLSQKVFGGVAAVALLMAVLIAPIGEVRADPTPDPNNEGFFCDDKKPCVRKADCSGLCLWVYDCDCWAGSPTCGC